MQFFKKLLSGKRSSTSEGRGSTAITKENLAKLQASLEPQGTDDDGATGDESKLWLSFVADGQALGDGINNLVSFPAACFFLRIV